MDRQSTGDPTEEEMQAVQLLREGVRQPPSSLLQRLDADIEASGGALNLDSSWEGAVGATMFDLPQSEDGTITVLLPQQYVHRAPSQALLRIESGKDGRRYIGMVTGGPFVEPDSLR